MLRKLLSLFKHKHKWEDMIGLTNYSLYEEGWDYWYKCKCGAIKRKFMTREEEILENKGDK